MLLQFVYYIYNYVRFEPVTETFLSNSERKCTYASGFVKKKPEIFVKSLCALYSQIIINSSLSLSNVALNFLKNGLEKLISSITRKNNKYSV